MIISIQFLLLFTRATFLATAGTATDTLPVEGGIRKTTLGAAGRMHGVDGVVSAMVVIK